MKHQTGKRTSMPRCAWPLALVAISAFAVALLAQLGSTVHAQEPDSDLGSQVSNTPPPPGDCWSGALSDDPLHCYALEEAQRDGIIEVEGVYDASGELHIFFNYRTGPPVSALFDQGRLEELVEVLKDNAREFVAQFPERVTYNLPFHFCGPPDPAETYRDCILNRTFELVVVPWDSPYIRIFLVSGGADARQTFPGWASWLQIWPATESSAAAASDGFDISDVDLVNFPEKMKCEDGFYSDYACEMAKQYPSWNIAGWHESEKDLFIQVKADPGEKPPPGEEDTAVAFLRAEFARRYGDTDSYGRLRDAVITPVKYSYEELWRWQLLLERFAVSSGNTIGITGADVVTNVTDYWVADNIIYLLSELQEADRNSFADFRETIAVYTSHDADQVTSLLPILLPQLGIPGDAVGILMQSSPTPPDIVVADIEIAGETANSAVDNAPEMSKRKWTRPNKRQMEPAKSFPLASSQLPKLRVRRTLLGKRRLRLMSRSPISTRRGLKRPRLFGSNRCPQTIVHRIPLATKPSKLNRRRPIFATRLWNRLMLPVTTRIPQPMMHRRS